MRSKPRVVIPMEGARAGHHGASDRSAPNTLAGATTSHVEQKAAAAGLPRGAPAPSSPQQAPLLCTSEIPADRSCPQGVPSPLASEEGGKQPGWESKTEAPQMK